MVTAWTPLGDVLVEQGAVLVCRGSHRSRSFSAIQGTYGQQLLGTDGGRLRLAPAACGLAASLQPLGLLAGCSREDGCSLAGWMALRTLPGWQAAPQLLKAAAAERTCAAGTRSGWLTDDGSRLSSLVSPHAVDWVTGDFAAGDALLLHLGVLHMTAANVTDTVRISCDTRWVAASGGACSGAASAEHMS